MVYYEKISNRFQPNLYIHERADKVLYFQAENNAGEPIDLTSYTGELKVFLDKEGTDDVPVITKALTLISAIEGKFSVTLTDAETALDYLPYKYRLDLTTGTDTFIFGDGMFIIKGDDSDRIARIRKKYNFVFSYDIMENAMQWAEKQVLDKGYMNITKTNLTTDSNNIISIPNYIADSNFTESVFFNDVRVYEYLDSSPYTVTEITPTDINIDHPTGKSYITLATSYPTSGFNLCVDYYQIVRPFTDALNDIRLLTELYFIRYLFETLSPYKLQQGMTEKTMNGQTIRFDQNAIKEYLKQNQKQITELTLNIKGIGAVDDLSSVQISKEYKY